MPLTAIAVSTTPTLLAAVHVEKKKGGTPALADATKDQRSVATPSKSAVRMPTLAARARKRTYLAKSACDVSLKQTAASKLECPKEEEVILLFQRWG